MVVPNGQEFPKTTSTEEEGEETGENDEKKTTGQNYGDRRGNEGVDWFDSVRGCRHFEDREVKTVG